MWTDDLATHLEKVILFDLFFPVVSFFSAMANTMVNRQINIYGIKLQKGFLPGFSMNFSSMAQLHRCIGGCSGICVNLMSGGTDVAVIVIQLQWY